MLVLVAAAAGGMVQIIPTVMMNRAKNVEDRLQLVPTPLELAGRDIYVSEGCYNCHSQMIRTLAPDVLRYGDYSRLGESIYDYPHQWGSKRTGPDLAREAGRRNNTWHYQHLMDPRALSAGSNMPSYHWLGEKKTDIKSLPGRIAVQQKLGVPFKAMTRDQIQQLAIEQSVGIAKDLKANGLYVDPESQMVAVIAYLQQLGKFDDLVKVKAAAAEAASMDAAFAEAAAATASAPPAAAPAPLVVPAAPPAAPVPPLVPAAAPAAPAPPVVPAAAPAAPAPTSPPAVPPAPAPVANPPAQN